MEKLTLEQAKKIMDRDAGHLDLSNTQITSLPEGLTVGGSLDLSDTPISSLPEGLIVGGYLDLSNTQIKVHKLKCGDYVPGKYLYADGILTHVKRRMEHSGYIFYQGRIPGQNIVSDGIYYAHCDKWEDGISDICFKKAEDRGLEQYRNLTLDSVLSEEEMISMYRIITGACQAGTERFVNSLKQRKATYTVREAIKLTDGQYNSKIFQNFFSE